jgi:hypothetical protein
LVVALGIEKVGYIIIKALEVVGLSGWTTLELVDSFKGSRGACMGRHKARL